jgi:hypothetical protein
MLVLISSGTIVKNEKTSSQKASENKVSESIPSLLAWLIYVKVPKSVLSLRTHTKRIRTRRSRSLGGFRCKYNGIWPTFRCDRLIFCKIKRPNQSRNGLKIEGTNIGESILYPGNWGYQIYQSNLLLILTKYIAATSLLLRKQDLWLKAIIVVRTAKQESRRPFNSPLVRVRLYFSTSQWHQ